MIQKASAKLQQQINNSDSIDQPKSLIIYGRPGLWPMILKSRHCEDIQILNLTANYINDDNIDLALSLDLTRISQLQMNSNCIGLQGFQKIIRKDYLCLKSLSVEGNQITEQGFIELISNCDKFAYLHTINLKYNKIDLKHNKIVLDKAAFENLKNLNLSFNYIGLPGVLLLTKLHMPLLQLMYLDDCKIGGKQAQHLSKGKWDNLKQLHLINAVNNYDFQTSIVRNSWKNLQQFFIYFKEPVSSFNYFIMRKNSDNLRFFPYMIQPIRNAQFRTMLSSLNRKSRKLL